jgi:hypothetical protein
MVGIVKHKLVVVMEGKVQRCRRLYSMPEVEDDEPVV